MRMEITNDDTFFLSRAIFFSEVPNSSSSNEIISIPRDLEDRQLEYEKKALRFRSIALSLNDDNNQAMFSPALDSYLNQVNSFLDDVIANDVNRPLVAEKAVLTRQFRKAENNLEYVKSFESFLLEKYDFNSDFNTMKWDYRVREFARFSGLTFNDTKSLFDSVNIFVLKTEEEHKILKENFDAIKKAEIDDENARIDAADFVYLGLEQTGIEAITYRQSIRFELDLEKYVMYKAQELQSNYPSMKADKISSFEEYLFGYYSSMISFDSAFHFKAENRKISFDNLVIPEGYVDDFFNHQVRLEIAQNKMNEGEENFYFYSIGLYKGAEEWVKRIPVLSNYLSDYSIYLDEFRKKSKKEGVNFSSLKYDVMSFSHYMNLNKENSSNERGETFYVLQGDLFYGRKNVVNSFNHFNLDNADIVPYDVAQRRKRSKEIVSYLLSELPQNLEPIQINSENQEFFLYLNSCFADLRENQVVGLDEGLYLIKRNGKIEYYGQVIML